MNVTLRRKPKLYSLPLVPGAEPQNRHHDPFVKGRGPESAVFCWG